MVIGLTRFLLRPRLRCANLATRSYRLLLSQVRTDWLERYGVGPELVETYVDRSTYTDKSLAAANWLRIGQSLGRGRTSASKQARPQSINLKTAIEMATKEHKDRKEKGFRGQGQRRVAHPASE